MSPSNKIFLTGFMTSGKSSIGKQLAKRLDLTFIDLDSEIEKSTGRKIEEIFKTDGEAHFRKLELDKLNELATNNDSFVMATGGGAPCSEAAQEILNSGMTIYLKISKGSLVGRLRQSRANRPLVKDITDRELPKFVDLMLEKRAPFYNKADIIIEDSNLSASKVESILKLQLM